MDYARNLLQELMSPYDQKNQKTFAGEDICKHFLVKFCPNELFVNTKSDLGVCTKIHDEQLRTQYQSSPDKGKVGYEERFYDYLMTLCSDLDRKIRRGKERLNIQPDDALLNPNKDEREEKIIILDEKISSLLNQVEIAGEEGRVAEAQELSNQVEKLQAELAALKENDESNPIFKQEKRMEVCDVCGAFLVMNDSSKRLDAHMEGKQHTGYLKIRDALVEFEKIYGGRRTSRSGSRRDRYRDFDDSHRRRSGRDHDRDRDRRDRDRDRDHDSEKRRRRSKDNGYVQDRDYDDGRRKSKDYHRHRSTSKSKSKSPVRS